MLTLLIALASAQFGEVAVPMKSYVNRQYGYKSCYSADMTPIRESVSPKGAVYVADWGSYSFYGDVDTRNRTPAQILGSLQDNSRDVVRREQGPGWASETGTHHGYWYWRKVFKKGNRYLTIHADDANYRDQLKVMVADFTKCTVFYG